MSKFLVSKTFPIPYLRYIPVYNFYTADEETNIDSTVYNKKEYVDILDTLFLKNELDTKMAARYIKLSWSLPESPFISWIPDSTIKNVVLNASDINTEQSVFELMNTSPLTDFYSEYGLLASSSTIYPEVNGSEKQTGNQYMVIGDEPLENNDLLTSPTTTDCFHKFVDNLDSVIQYDNSNTNILSKYVDPKEDIGNVICGYIIAKYEVGENDATTLKQIIIGQDPFCGFYYDYRVSYNKTYKYKMAFIQRLVYGWQVKVVVRSGVSFTKTTKRKEFFIGHFSNLVESIIIDKIPPNYPSDIRVYPDKERTDKFIMVWGNVLQKSKDIDRYLVWRRLNVDESEWEKMQESNELDYVEYLTDSEPTNFKKYGYIYAIQSIDKHGNASTLSRQLNIQFKQLGNKNTVDVRMYLGGGLDFNVKSIIPDENEKTIYMDASVSKISILPGANFDDKNYQIKVTSDTGDVRVFNINSKITPKDDSWKNIMESSKESNKKSNKKSLKDDKNIMESSKESNKKISKGR